MEENRKYDVFISYRWDGGDQCAWLLHDHLLNAGYRVYLDMEGFNHGDFNEQILGIIRNCRDLIPILSPGALNPREGRDYLREELRAAVESGVNVVPYLLPGFEWPGERPDWLEKVKGSTGASYSKEYFPATVTKVKSLLTAAPRTEESPAAQPATPPEAGPKAAPVRREAPEPDFPLRVLEPDKKRFLGMSYSKDLMARIRKENREQLTDLRGELNRLLDRTSSDPLEAFQKAWIAMRLVRDQLGAYPFWEWDVDQARIPFVKNYEDNLNQLRREAESGEPSLSPEGLRQLKLFGTGLDQVIQALDN